MWLKREFIFNPVTAELYDFLAWPFVYMTASLMRRELAELPKGSRVLEVGTGTGLLIGQLARELDMDFTGVEPSPDMLNKARGKLAGFRNITLLSDRAERLPEGDFDAVLFSYVFRHISPESLSDVTMEIKRVSKPNAKILIADMYLPMTGAFPSGIGRENPNYLILGVLAVYDPASLGRYLEGRGFKFQSLSYYPLSFLLSMKGG